MKWFITVNTLVDGNFFGELALESDKPRAASIVCESDVILALISKTDYNRII